MGSRVFWAYPILSRLTVEFTSSVCVEVFLNVLWFVVSQNSLPIQIIFTILFLIPLLALPIFELYHFYWIRNILKRSTYARTSSDLDFVVERVLLHLIDIITVLIPLTSAIFWLSGAQIAFTKFMLFLILLSLACLLFCNGFFPCMNQRWLTTYLSFGPERRRAYLYTFIPNTVQSVVRFHVEKM